MSKFYALAAAMATVLGASAAVPVSQKAQMPEPLKGRTEVPAFRTADGRLCRHSDNSARMFRAAEGELPAPTTEVIYEPQGRRQDYAKNCAGFYLSWFGVMPFENTLSTHIVWGENNDVYLYDPTTMAGSEAYVKGTLNNGKITVNLPQTMMWLENEEDPESAYGIDLYVVELREDGVDEETGETLYWYFPDYDKTTVTWTVNADGSVVMEDLGEDCMIGLVYTDEYDWVGYGEKYQDMSEFNEKPLYETIPANLETEQWVYRDAEDVSLMDVGFDGNDVYLFFPNGVMKGQVDGDRILVAQDVYLGLYYDYLMFSKVATVDLETGNMALVDASEPFVIDYDKEGKTMAAADPGLALLINADKNKVLYLAMYMDFSIYFQDDFSGTPANPYGLYWSTDYFDYQGFNDFVFFIPMFSTDDNLLDTSCLSYRVFMDGELMEFLPEDYSDLEETGPMTNIPYDFNTYNQFFNYGGEQRSVGIFADGVTTLGVQSVYNYKGVTTMSDIMVLDLESGEVSNGVKAVAGNASVESTAIYDLNGMEVRNPGKGIYVVKSVLSDGTVKTVKKAVR